MQDQVCRGSGTPGGSGGGAAGSELHAIDERHTIPEWRLHPRDRPGSASREREFFIDNLLVRIRLIIEMSLVDRPCAMGV